MKSNAPWSVKGIARDTRETAKEAARKEGLTVGEWLNRLVDQTKKDGFSTSGEIDGVVTKDLVTAIEHVNTRLHENDKDHLKQINELANNLTVITKRLQNIESHTNDGVSAEIGERLNRIEEKSNDRDRINALRALEKAVSQIAVQFDQTNKMTVSRIESNEQHLQQFAGRLEGVDQSLDALAKQSSNSGEPEAPKEVSALKENIAAVNQRIEQIEANNPNNIADPDFAERTGKRLRVLGDEIKRGGDQINILEGLIERLADQIDAAEKRSAEAIQRVNETITGLQTHLSTQGSGSKQNIAPTIDLETLRNEITQAIDKSQQDTNAKITALSALVEHKNIDKAPATNNTVDNNGVNDLNAHEYASATTQSTHSDIMSAIPDNTAPDSGNFDDVERDETHSTHTAPFETTGSLYDEDDVEEITMDSDFTSAFEELDFDDSPQKPNESHAEGQISDTHEDLSANLDDDPDEARKIADEINQALRGDIDDNSAVHQPQFEDETPDDTLNDIIDSFDPLDAPGETIAKPLHARSENLNKDSHTSMPLDDNSHHGIMDNHNIDNDFAHEDPTSPRSNIIDGAASATPDQPSHEELTEADIINRRAKMSPGKLPRTPEGKIDVARLTPKQKAILSARARKKREMTAAAKQSRSNPVNEQTEDISPVSRIRRSVHKSNMGALDEEPVSLFSRLKGFLPGGKKDLIDDFEDTGRKKKDQKHKGITSTTDHRFDFSDDEASRNSIFLENERPTKISIAIFSIVLLGVILLSIRQFIFQSDPDTNGAGSSLSSPSSLDLSRSQSPLTTPVNTERGLSPNSGSIETPSIASPSELNDTLRPRNLYRQAMAVLSASPDEASAQNAISELTRAGSLGYPPAQFQLGEYYKNGTHVELNAVTARSWFQRAANGGNVFAMHRLGYLFAEGTGGNADIVTAILWFEQAANLGFIDSQYNLGAIYDPGTDTQPATYKNLGKAYYWYSISAQNNDKQAQNKADGIAARLNPEEKARIDGQIAAWKANPIDSAANESFTEA